MVTRSFTLKNKVFKSDQLLRVNRESEGFLETKIEINLATKIVYDHIEGINTMQTRGVTIYLYQRDNWMLGGWKGVNCRLYE